MRLGARPIYVSMLAGVAFVAVYIATFIGVRSLTGYDSYWAKTIVVPMIILHRNFTERITSFFVEAPPFDQPYFMVIELMMDLLSLWLSVSVVAYVAISAGKALQARRLR